MKTKTGSPEHGAYYLTDTEEDGDWFLCAYDAAGNPVGSRSCDEGQIYIEPQGMCVMAGIGVENGLAARALESVKERLDTKYGIVLHQPAYTKYYERRISLICRRQKDGYKTGCETRLIGPSLKSMVIMQNNCHVL